MNELLANIVYELSLTYEDTELEIKHYEINDLYELTAHTKNTSITILQTISEAMYKLIGDDSKANISIAYLYNNNKSTIYLTTIK